MWADGVGLIGGINLYRIARAGVIQLGSWSAARANCTNGFVAELDDNSASKKHHMRELGQWRDLTSPALF
jgi:hypothetical protein